MSSLLKSPDPWQTVVERGTQLSAPMLWRGECYIVSVDLGVTTGSGLGGHENLGA